MKQVENPDTILKWRDKLVKVVAIAQGKTIYMQPLDAEKCIVCGHAEEISALEHSPLFQENAEPVETLKT